jgi:hypothetical protein
MAGKNLRKGARAEHRWSKRLIAWRDSRPVRMLGTLSEVADQPPLVALSLGTLASGLVAREPAVARTGARMLASLAVATGIKTVLKRAVDRSRPARSARDGDASLNKAHGKTETDYNSFPSGHTAGAVSVAQAVARGHVAAGRATRAGAAAIGLLQPARGKHYVSDVVAGAAIGWASERIAHAAITAAEAYLRRVAAARADRLALAETVAHPS